MERTRPTPHVFSPDDERELYALVVQAVEFRGNPYFLDATQAIEDWFLRLPIHRRERRDERNANLVRLLRETDPARTPSDCAASPPLDLSPQSGLRRDGATAVPLTAARSADLLEAAAA